MKIDAGTNSYLYTNQRAQSLTSDHAAARSLSNAAAQNGGTKQVDFTNMNHTEMRDWVNMQIRSGGMSLDDSRPFMAMTMKIPVGGSVGSELSTVHEGERYDFTQKARDGIAAALLRNDETTLMMLESAMQIMERHQGQVIGIEIQA